MAIDDSAESDIESVRVQIEDQQRGQVISRSEAIVRENANVVIENPHSGAEALAEDSYTAPASNEAGVEDLSCVVVDNPHAEMEDMDRLPGLSQHTTEHGVEDIHS